MGFFFPPIFFHRFFSSHITHSIKLTMAEQYIKYEADFRLMICLLCNEGINKDWIARHY